MRRSFKTASFALLFSLVLGIPSLWALWIADGVPICTAVDNQHQPQIVYDGTGGAIIAWVDDRDISPPNNNKDIYARRIDSFGNTQWTTNGNPVCTEWWRQEGCQIASDGQGGAFITWWDERTSPGGIDIYAIRMLPNGNRASSFPLNGVPICTETGTQWENRIISDGGTGAIIVWKDLRSVGSDIYAQKIDAAGNVQWTTGGVAICTTATGNKSNPQIASDGAEGAIITWGDASGVGGGDIYAQRIDASGNVQWATNGVGICTGALQQVGPQIASDGVGGAVITWSDQSGDIYAQRVNSAGTVQWVANGVAICTAAGKQHVPLIVSDGAGGAIITWKDQRNSAGWPYEIYARRVTAAGNVLWATDGILIGAESDYFGTHDTVADGSGGAIVTWMDYRSGTEFDIYAQAIDAAGGYQWEAGGLAISTAPLDQRHPRLTITTEGDVVIAWQDDRNTGLGTASDIYAQRVIGCSGSSHLYVDHDAPGNQTGRSWGNAFTELRDALSHALLCGDVSEIWVAEGTYTPTGGTDRTATFHLRNNLILYGGFAGTETLLNERDWLTNVTILSGDIGVLADSTDNSYHVVTGSGTDATAVIDGFTITKGNADVVGPQGEGGGMDIDFGSPRIVNVTFARNDGRFGGGLANYGNNSNPALENVVFWENSVTSSGGGMYGAFGNPTLDDVVFLGNSAGSYGGGMHNSGNSSPNLLNVTFSGNSAGSRGGGMYNAGGTSTLFNVVFSGNSAGSYGGGMVNSSTSPTLSNVAFSGNSGSAGGGIYNTSNSNPTLINTILWGDTASIIGDEIYNLSGSTPVISYSLVEGCGGSGGGWNPALGTDNGHNIDDNPQFKGVHFPDSPLAVWSSSPAVNAGDNAAVPIGVTTDIDGNPRIYGGTVDMGAYEHQGPKTGVNDDPQQTPAAFVIYQNVPNPFNPSTSIRFDLPYAEHVRLSVYNVKGELISTVVNEHMTEGHKEITWSAKDNKGRLVSSGVYFYRLVAGDFAQTRKMVLLK